MKTRLPCYVSTFVLLTACGGGGGGGARNDGGAGDSGDTGVSPPARFSLTIGPAAAT